MNTFKYTMALCTATFIAAACQPESAPQQDGPSISVTLISEAPVNARPGEEVSYTFSLAYRNGLAEAVAMLDNAEIEGTKAIYENSPAEETFSFSYTPTDVQTGTTLDFVVSVTGADGAMKTYDVPLYILAKEADILITVPSDAPESHEIGTDLAFTVKVTSSIDIKSIKTFKNSIELPDLEMEEFTDPQNVDYEFIYNPAAADVGAPVSFMFQAMDVNGNIVSEEYTVTFTKQESSELNEFFSITMGYQNCTTAGQYLSSSTGQVFKMSEGGENAALIDIVIYYSGNTTTQGLGITSPSTTNARTMYGNATTIKNNGGDDDDIITNWSPINSVTFKLLCGNIKDETQAEITLEDFAGLSKASELEALYNNSQAAENVTVLMVQPESIFAFKTSAGKYGVLRIVSRDSNNKGTVVVDLKSVK